MKNKFFKNLYKRSLKYEGLVVRGYLPGSNLITSLQHTGFQATNLAQATKIFNKYKNVPFVLGFTSNAITSGLRDTIAHFIKKYKPIAIVTTAGSIEQDYIKTQNNFKLLNLKNTDSVLNKKGFNRSGNIIVENSHYIWFEQNMKTKMKNISEVRQIITRLSEDLTDDNSFLKQAHDNRINVYCPGILDGAIGDFFYFHRQNYKQIDILASHVQFTNLVLSQNKLGAVLLGGSMPKHYIYNANICRGGLDYLIHFSTELDYDGSNAGANPSQAVSWGKINTAKNTRKIIGDFTINFTLFIKMLG